MSTASPMLNPFYFPIWPQVFTLVCKQSNISRIFLDNLPLWPDNTNDYFIFDNLVKSCSAPFSSTERRFPLSPSEMNSDIPPTSGRREKHPGRLADIQISRFP